MELKQTFWQNKLSPKELIIDWDRFIGIYEEYILQSISIRLNSLQKQFIKHLIDPENRNLVYKNSYLMFTKNFWDLPSNRTKLLKGQINLSKMPQKRSITDLKKQYSVLLKISYFEDLQQNEQVKNKPNRLNQKVFKWQKQKVQLLDNKMKVIEDKLVKNDSFLTVGRSQTNDITILNCQHINLEHFKLIRQVVKKQKQKRPIYMLDEQDVNNEETVYYVRDTSKSSRMFYQFDSQSKRIVMRAGMVLKFGLIDEYQIQILKATPQQVGEAHLKQLQALLNEDRINYLGDIDPKIPQKFIIQIPVKKNKVSDIERWYNQQLHYEQAQNVRIKMKIDDLSGKQEQIPLRFKLFNKTTQQSKEYTFSGQTVKIGRNKKNTISIDKLSMRNIECEFVCVTGVWLLKNINQNYSLNLSQNQSQNQQQMIKKLRLQNLSIGLATKDSIQCLQSSNRINLTPETSHTLRGNNFIVNISFTKQK